MDYRFPFSQPFNRSEPFGDGLRGYGDMRGDGGPLTFDSAVWSAQELDYMGESVGMGFRGRNNGDGNTHEHEPLDCYAILNDGVMFEYHSDLQHSVQLLALLPLIRHY